MPFLETVSFSLKGLSDSDSFPAALYLYETLPPNVSSRIITDHRKSPAKSRFPVKRHHLSSFRDRQLLYLSVLNLPVERLQRMYLAVSGFLYVQNPLHRRFGGCNGSHVRNLRLNGRLPQIAVIVYTVISYG